MEDRLSEYGRLLTWIAVACVVGLILLWLARRWVPVSPHAVAVLLAVVALCVLGILLDWTIL